MIPRRIILTWTGAVLAGAIVAGVAWEIWKGVFGG
jgi:hypothetical protein